MSRDSRAYKILTSMYHGVLKRQRILEWRRKLKEGLQRKPNASLEPLEPRVLLSGDTPWVVDLDDHGATAVTVGLNPGNDHIEVSSNDALLASRPLADTNLLDIRGDENSATDESVTVDASLFGKLPIHFDGKGGSDELIGPDVSVDWRVTGDNSGQIDAVNNNHVTFENVEDLTGGVDNEDNFIFNESGSISGRVEGGAGGFDTVTIEGGNYNNVSYVATGPDSGIVDLDGQLIRYFGFEPIVNTGNVVDASFEATAGADTFTIIDGVPGTEVILDSINGTFEDTTTALPSHSLRVNAGDGDDTINYEMVFNSTTVRIDGGDGSDTLDLSARAVNMTAVLLSDGSYILTDGIGPNVELRNIENVVGAEFTLQANGIPSWVEEGPGSLNRDPNRAIFRGLPWSGAVEAIAPHPANANIMFAGTVNGGVWRSVDAGANWEPLTDQFPSLAIGALVISTHDNAGNPVTGGTPVENLVLYAGTGATSNFGGAGGQSVGVLRSVNGGDTWDLLAPPEMLGLSISSVVATRIAGEDIVLVGTVANSITTRDVGGLTPRVVKAGGIFRSTDGGNTFTKNEIVAPSLSMDPLGYTFPFSSVTDIVQDLGTPSRMYTSVVGGGVYESDDAGATWDLYSAGLTLGFDGVDNDAINGRDTASESAAGAGRIVLAVQPDPMSANNAVYAALISKETNWLMGVFRRAPGDANWALVGSNAAPRLQTNASFERNAAGTSTNLLTGDPNLTIVGGANPTITRFDGVSWLDEGFNANRLIGLVPPGGSIENYHTTNVTASVITLAAGPNINPVAMTNGFAMGQYRLAPIQIAGDPNLVFSAAASTITRDSGNWHNDGFMVGHEVAVTNSASNNNTFVITALTPTVMTLTRPVTAPTTVLTNEGMPGPGMGVNGITITGNAIIGSTPDGVQPQIHFGQQGIRNTGFNVDAAGNVFIGGDTQSRGANIFWFDTGASVWRYAFPNGSHPDGRVIEFDANGNILQGDDGGMYRWNNPTVQIRSTGSFSYNQGTPDTITRTTGSFVTDGFVAGMRVGVHPTTNGMRLRDFGQHTVTNVTATTLTLEAQDNARVTPANTLVTGTELVGSDWDNLNTGRGAVEVLSVAYDPLNNVIIAGTQDNAIAEQPSPGNMVDDDNDTFTDEEDERLFWTEVAVIIRPGDGNTSAVVPINNDGDPQFDIVRRYTMSNGFDTLAVRDFDANGVMVPGTDRLVGLSSTTPIAITGINAGTNTITAPMHGLSTGDPVFFNTTGNIPGGLHEAGAFFAIVGANANTLQLAETANDAAMGTAINITSAGSGTQTLVRRFTGISNNDQRFLDSFTRWPYVVNAVDSSRMLMGIGDIYESLNIGTAMAPQFNGLDTITQVTTPAVAAGNSNDFVSALAYGGRKMGMDVPDVIYAAFGNEIMVRFVNNGMAGDFGSEQIGAANFIHDIVLDPEDHDIAYAATDVGVFKRTAGMPGMGTWALISQRMNRVNPDVRTLEFAHVDGHGVLLAGGAAGVFRAIDPAPGVVWTEFGNNLPNALLFDLDLTERDPADFENPRMIDRSDVLLAGTLGRGVWSVSDVDEFLAEPSVLILNGTAGDDTFTIRRNEANPSLVEVSFDESVGDPPFMVPISGLQEIQVLGEGGNDTLIVDSTDGPINLPDGITYNGGAGASNALTLEGQAAAFTSTNTVGPVTTIRIVDARNGEVQVVSYENVDPGNVTNNVTAATDAESTGAGWSGLINLLAAWETGSGEELALVGQSLPRALSGRSTAAASPAGELPGATGGDVMPDPLATEPLADTVLGGFARLIEEGPNGFSLGEIENFTPQELHDRLEALDEVENVSFTEVGDTTRFDARVVRRIGGEGDIDILAEQFGGILNLAGLMDISAEVELRLVFGTDSNGFFIETASNASGLTIRDIEASGTPSAGGRIGFIDVTLAEAELMVDPSLELDIVLIDPSPGDDIIRLDELIDAAQTDTGLDDMIDFNITGSAADDLVFTVDARVAAFLPGGDAPFDLGEANVTFTWNDVTDPLTVGVSASAGIAEDLLNFLRVDVQQVLTQIQSLSQFSVSFNGQEIPLLQDGLDVIVDIATFLDENIISPLTNASGMAGFGSIQGLVSQVADAIGIDPAALGLSYDSTTKELTWAFDFEESIFASDTLALGFDLEAGLADLQVSSDASIEATFGFDITVGIDFDDLLATPAEPTRWIFIKDPAVTAGLAITASNLDASARFGFASIEVVDGELAANANFTLSLSDPGTISANNRIDLGELGDALGTLSLDFTGSATVSLPLSIPFLGVTPSVDTTLGLIWADLSDPSTIDVQLPPNLLDLSNFTNMDAGTFVGLLGQIANWLEDFRNSFDVANIPLVGETLDDVLEFADLLSDSILFDDGDDGVDGQDKLVTDINDALATAGIGDRIAAEADGDTVKLIAISSGVTEFTVSGNGLGFGSVQPAASVAAQIELTGSSPAPADGILGVDVLLNIAINGASAVAVTIAAASTSSNTGLGNDKRKLLDANNRATFTTVQEMASRFINIIGLDVVQYDPVTEELTIDLTLGDVSSNSNFGTLDLPIQFDLLQDLAPIAELSSDSLIQLSAGGGLSLTVGLFLGNTGAIELSNATELSSLRDDGIEFSEARVISAANSARTVFGRLSADASFNLSRNGDPAETISLPRSVTENNATLADLASDINAAIGASPLSGQVTATVDDKGTLDNEADDQIVLSGDGGTTELVLTSDPSGPMVREAGFGAEVTSVDETGTQVLRFTTPGLVGRPSQDVTFNVSLNTVNGGASTPVMISGDDLRSNRNILELVVDVQRALDDAGFEDKIEVGSSGLSLLFKTLEPGATTFSMTASGDAVTELGLAASASGSQADMIITTGDGVSHEIVLDGLTTLGQVISAIESGTSNDVDVQFTANDTRLLLIDNSGGSDPLLVANAFGSNAADDLAISKPMTIEPDGGAPEGDELPPEDRIEGGLLGGIDPLDRLFIRNAQAAATLGISTPGGLNATARFGFVEITGTGSITGDNGVGTMTGGISVGLKPVDAMAFDPTAKITLKDLLDNISNIGDFFDGPTITGEGELELAVSIMPALGFINTDANPTLKIDITSLAEVLDGSDDGDQGYIITTNGFDELLNFENVGFSDIVAALRALLSFLEQFEEFGFLNEDIPVLDFSINDVLAFAEDFAMALDEVEENPAGTVQVLEEKLKEAMGIPMASDLLELSLVDGDILRIDLNFDPSFSESMPISLALPIDAGVVDLSGAADLRADGNLDMTLAVGIDLSNLTNFWVFEDTGIAGMLTAGADDIAFNATLGGLGLQIIEGDAEIMGNFSLGLDETAMTHGSGDNQRTLIQDILGDLGSFVDFSLTGTIDGMLPVFILGQETGTIEIGGALSLDLDGGLEVGGTLTGPDTYLDNFVRVPSDIFNIDFSQFSALDNILLIIDGVDGFLGLLQDLFDGEFAGFTVPLIGDQLVEAADVIKDFREDFIGGLREAVETSNDPDQNFISQALFDLLHTQLGILEDRNNDGNITTSDIQLQTNVDDMGVAPEDVYMEWFLNLGGTLVDAGAGLDFQLGVPGLNFETRGEINVEVDWELAFGFGIGISRGGFYIDTSDTNELELNVDVTIPGGGFTGTLGFLQLDAMDTGDTRLGATFGVDLFKQGKKVPVTDEDSRLGIGELGDLRIDIGVAAEANVEVDLELRLSDELLSSASSVFPKVVAEFVLLWEIGDRDAGVLVGFDTIGDAIQDGLKVVEFRNVGVDLGSFISDFLTPIVEQVQEFTKPLQPLIDVLTAPIPVISDSQG